MGSLAGLLRAEGHRVTGSDQAFYPPMGDALQAWGIETFQGFCADHLEPRPDWVVVGNVCRRDNVEAQAAIGLGLPYASMPKTLSEFILAQRRPLVVAGTHGKTTTSALLAYLLEGAEQSPGYLLGGVPINARVSFAAGKPDGYFVIEGDEYDSAFFEKTPKFWSYRPQAAILTSVEYDHVDIYDSVDSYLHAFEHFVQLMPDTGRLVAYAGDPQVRSLARHARCVVEYYAVDGDACGDIEPVWLAVPAATSVEGQSFDLFASGNLVGRGQTRLVGLHNLRNIVAAIALSATVAQVPLRTLLSSLPSFHGMRRRQELLSDANGMFIYDDFAHHPTAVRETLLALRRKHPDKRLVAVFEPRSATASRQIHQTEYPDALLVADVIMLAPIGKANVPETERLNTHVVAKALTAKGKDAHATADHASLWQLLVSTVAADDVIVFMSNGDFGGLPKRLVDNMPSTTG